MENETPKDFAKELNKIATNALEVKYNNLCTYALEVCKDKASQGLFTAHIKHESIESCRSKFKEFLLSHGLTANFFGYNGDEVNIYWSSPK